MPTKLRRRAVALATALACLVLLVTPAAATTHGATITGGILEFFTTYGTTGFLNSDLPVAGTVGTGCGSTLAIDEDGGAGTFDLVQFTSTGRVLLGSSHFVAVMTRQSSTAGTYSGTALTSATMTLRVEFFPATNSSSTATDCAHGATRSCRYTLTIHILGSSAGWTASTDVALYSGWSSSIGVSPPCTTAFQDYSNGYAQIGNLDIHLTT